MCKRVWRNVCRSNGVEEDKSNEFIVDFCIFGKFFVIYRLFCSRRNSWCGDGGV